MDEPVIRLGVEVATHIREEISRAGGNEICFLGRLDASREVVEIRVVARGNSTAVLAAVREFDPGQILIHNHPSGILSPSDADLAVAERLWSEGLGFAITDNDAKSLYVVVAPPKERTLQVLAPQVVEADLAPVGGVARFHASYEDRPHQRDLARQIVERYNETGIAIAEAGTGTGKSAAYLVPAIRWAALNRERTVVSTNTINLQEQLVQKDLPFLRRALGIPFSFALVKGRNNYISIRRAKLAMISADSLFPDDRGKELRALEEWLDRTEDGSLSDLPFTPSPEVWDEVASDSDVCLRAKCPHFESCFYQTARRDAAGADILVVNHHLLFSDLAVRQTAGNYSAPAVLPHYRRLVLDEAHNLEDTATRHMGATLTRRTFHRLLRRLEHRGKGILPSLEKALAMESGDLIAGECLRLLQERLRPELEGAWKRGSAVFDIMEAVARTNEGGILRLRDSFYEDPIWNDGLEEELAAALAHLDTLVRGFNGLRDQIAQNEVLAEKLEERVLEVRGVTYRLEAAALAMKATLRKGDGDDRVRWVEYRAPRGQHSEGLRGNTIIAAAPLDMGGVLRETLFERIPTVILTSATLATSEGFDFIRTRLGLARGIDVHESIYPSPFDFSTQSILAIPTDLPPPAGGDNKRHQEATVRMILKMAEMTDGGLFVLFTSHRALRAAAAELRKRGVNGRWPVLAQGDAPRGQILRSFVESRHAILLGTDSFWEGVDIPGDPLRGIIIPRIPFRVPTEPITEARTEAIEAAGGNAFMHYSLPLAAIRLKQGFGRLIRSRTDRGAVVVMDSRISSMRYGKYLIDSLPPAKLIVAPWSTCQTELQTFYRGSTLDGPVMPA